MCFLFSFFYVYIKCVKIIFFVVGTFTVKTCIYGYSVASIVGYNFRN